MENNYTENRYYDEDEINLIVEKSQSSEYIDEKTKGKNLLEYLRHKRKKR